MQEFLLFLGNTVIPILLIFSIKLLDVVLQSLRLTFLLKGQKKFVFIFSFLEVLIYLYSLNFVLSDIYNPVKLLTYALSYALGSVLSIEIEKKMSIGTLTFLVVPSIEDNMEMVENLKIKGFGVTRLLGKGVDNDSREILLITTMRKNGTSLRQTIDEIAPGSFMSIIDTKKVLNGKI